MFEPENIDKTGSLVGKYNKYEYIIAGLVGRYLVSPTLPNFVCQFNPGVLMKKK